MCVFSAVISMKNSIHRCAIVRKKNTGISTSDIAAISGREAPHPQLNDGTKWPVVNSPSHRVFLSSADFYIYCKKRIKEGKYDVTVSYDSRVGAFTPHESGINFNCWKTFNQVLIGLESWPKKLGNIWKMRYHSDAPKINMEDPSLVRRLKKFLSTGTIERMHEQVKSNSQ